MDKSGVIIWEIILGIIMLLLGVIGWWIQSSVSVDTLTAEQTWLFVGLIIFGFISIVVGTIER